MVLPRTGKEGKTKGVVKDRVCVYVCMYIGIYACMYVYIYTSDDDDIEEGTWP